MQIKFLIVKKYRDMNSRVRKLQVKKRWCLIFKHLSVLLYMYIMYKFLHVMLATRFFDSALFLWHQRTSNVGSVVEFSPATREARVRFPDVAFLYFFTNLKYFLVVWTYHCMWHTVCQLSNFMKRLKVKDPAKIEQLLSSYIFRARNSRDCKVFVNSVAREIFQCRVWNYNASN